jgi:hypothetical protein
LRNSSENGFLAFPCGRRATHIQRAPLLEDRLAIERRHPGSVAIEELRVAGDLHFALRDVSLPQRIDIANTSSGSRDVNDWAWYSGKCIAPT